jgi:hypothetical protein
MSMAYTHVFVFSVIVGYLLTVLGAVLALAAVIWRALAEERPDGQPPAAFRALCTVAFLTFVAGIVWQLIGYLRLEYHRLVRVIYSVGPQDRW